MKEISGQFPMGTIVAFALAQNNIPRGWLLCDGSKIPAKYQEFATLLGSDHTPNLCGRTLIGTGQGDNSIQSDGKKPNFDSTNFPVGYTGGEFVHLLQSTEIPPHHHTQIFGAMGKEPRDPYEGNDLRTCTGWNKYPMQTVTDTQYGNSAGTTDPHNTMQPFWAVNYIIYTGNPS